MFQEEEEPPYVPLKSAEDLRNEGNEQFKKGEYKEAILKYEVNKNRLNCDLTFLREKELNRPFGVFSSMYV